MFNYEERDIRTLLIDDEPWWVLKDVCEVLSLGGSHKVSERLDEDERSLIPLADKRGRNQKTTVINESGLYSVILRSDKPKAKSFKRWITHEVLPALRKTGSYSMQDEPAPPPSVETGLQRAGLIIRAAEHKAVPQSEQLRLLDIAIRDLTGKGLDHTPVADIQAKSLMELPEVTGALKKGCRKKISIGLGGSTTVQLYTLTEIADMAGVSPTEFNRFADKHGLKKPYNGEWFRVNTTSGEAREFLYLKDVIREFTREEV
ncbi:MAG: BRO family protein [Oscillospiraceae bacterium]|nr:BRO family protein [Oscillospiraceae bacterium]